MTSDECGNVDDNHGSTILSSIYFQPKIVDAYLKSTLESSNFPKQSIRALSNILPKHPNVIGAQRGVADAFDEIAVLLSNEQEEALREVIKALSAHLVILAQKKGAEAASDGEKETIEEARKRCLLGYCKILNKQWIEAAVDLDLVRDDLYRRSKRKKGDKRIMSLYCDALYGLELTCYLTEKASDAARYAKWRKQAIEDL